MRKLLLLTLLLTLPGLAQAQWTFDKVFPDSTSNDNRQNHGLAVDPAGKVWIQSYYPQSGDSVYVEALGMRQRVVALYCYEPNGTQCSFSPITVATFPGGEMDTLGGYLMRNDKGEQVWDYKSGRGLRTDNHGNILAVFYNDLYRINYQTGEGMTKAHLQDIAPLDTRGATAPAVDDFGSIFITGVFNGDPIVVLNEDFSFRENAVDESNSISRAFEVSGDGNSIYYAGYNQKRVFRYSRTDSFDPFGQTPDTLLTGFAAESFAWHPNGDLWISAGSPNDVPNEPMYMRNTWYAFDVADFSVKKDSIVWEEVNSVGRPRAIAFTASGDTVYVGQFSQGLHAVQRFVNKSGVSVDPTGQLPMGFSLKGNYPNPVSGMTTIEFAMSATAHATLKVYDTLGREVATLVDQMLTPETYNVNFDTANLPSGLYVYRLSAGNNSLTGTMTVIR